MKKIVGDVYVQTWNKNSVSIVEKMKMKVLYTYKYFKASLKDQSTLLSNYDNNILVWAI